jgi:hypothetical protein
MPGKSRKIGRRVLSRDQRYARELLAQFHKTPPELVKDIRAFPAWRWEKLRYNGVLVKDLVVGHLPRNSRPARRAREWEWGFYQYRCPRWVPWVIYVKEHQHKGLFQRLAKRRPKGRLFDDLAPETRAEAERLYSQFCERWKGHVGSEAERETAQFNWRRPLLLAAARRMARDPYTRSPEWGRQMRRIKGGKHVQQRYRYQGWHPLASVRKAWGLAFDRPPTGLSLSARLRAMTEREI